MIAAPLSREKLMRPNLVPAAIAACGVMWTAGCTPSPRLTPNAANEVAIVQKLGVPRPGEIAAQAIARDYLIGPFDQVSVRIIGFTGFDTDAQVDGSGRIQLPLVGSVIAAGKTPAQLSTELDGAYRQTYLKKPSVTVSVREIKSQFVTVEGAVRQPGVYPAFGPLKLNSALALAQGTNEFAAFGNVAVFRTIDGKQYAAVFNLKDIRKGLYSDPDIYPSDTVIVGESQVRRAFRDIITVAPFVAVFRPFG